MGLKSACEPPSLGPVRDERLSVTVVIPTRPGQAEIAAVAGARELNDSCGTLEILVARGRQPAIQRNAAIKAAGGALIYFLDDDSVPRPDNLARARRHFADPAVQMVGGPNVCPPEAPALEQVFAVALSSWLAFGPSRARYAPVGSVRETSEKELILCNLAARRAALLEAGGFDESLYPNEENALMDALQRRGGKLVYDPDFVVYRRPRPTLKAFARMVMTYGRGRAEQFRLHPTLGSALNFVPPLFCLYLLALPLLLVSPLKTLTLASLAFYGIAVLLQTLASAASAGVVRSALAAPLVMLTHLGYGFGFWRGLFTRLGPSGLQPVTEVSLERIVQ
jgi:succinoglycan biosynthesis protein ExoA